LNGLPLSGFRLVCASGNPANDLAEIRLRRMRGNGLSRTGVPARQVQ
jgi:hypothetical protein